MKKTNERVLVLTSGGLDSSILLAKLLAQDQSVFPLYISSGNRWEKIEQQWLRHYLKSIACPKLKPLVSLEFPMRDVFRNAWFINGKKVPGGRSKAEAVYLPGKNVILIAKAAVYCTQRKIHRVALAPLKTNPFCDAKRAFFNQYERALSAGLDFPIQIVTPFLNCTKENVMKMGRSLPLELTFSCLNPRGERHCGHCNKCAERKLAFRSAGLADKTCYVD